MSVARAAQLAITRAAVPRIRPHVIHIGLKFVDFRRASDSKFVDKRLASHSARPVMFDLPEGAVGTVRRGEERSPQRRRSDRNRTSVRARSTADPGEAG